MSKTKENGTGPIDGRLPYITFYPDAWLGDLGLQSLDYFHQGVWWRLLQAMHHSPKRGVLLHDHGEPMDDAAIAGLLKLPLRRWLKVKGNLLARGVASFDHQLVALFNRKMRRDQELRDKRRAAGSMGGQQTASNRRSKDAAEGSKPSAHALAPESSSSNSKSSGSSGEGGVGGGGGLEDGILDVAQPGVGLEILRDELGIEPSVALNLAGSVPLRELAAVRLAAANLSNPAGWARTALEKRWRRDQDIPPEEAERLVERVRARRQAAEGKLPPPRPRDPETERRPGEPEGDWLRRVTELRRKRSRAGGGGA